MAKVQRVTVGQVRKALDKLIPLVRREAGTWDEKTRLEIKRHATTLVLHAFDTTRPTQKAKRPERIVGQCVCGADILLGERYSMATKGPTTVKRACACKRVNEVVLTAYVEVQHATWRVRECFCGTPIYLRRDYAGENFPEGPQTIFAHSDGYKNRTVMQSCPTCTCKWWCTIKFTHKKQGGITRVVTFKFQRCAQHRDESIPEA